MPPRRASAIRRTQACQEWVILRSDNANPSFERYAAFVESKSELAARAAVSPPR